MPTWATRSAPFPTCNTPVLEALKSFFGMVYCLLSRAATREKNQVELEAEKKKKKNKAKMHCWFLKFTC